MAAPDTRWSGRPETVSKFSVPLSELAEGDFAVDAAASEAEVRPDGAEELGIDEVRLTGHLSETGMGYFFHGRLTSAFARRCDRCLEDTKAPVDLDVLWAFEPGTVVDPIEELMGEDPDEISEEDDSSGTIKFSGDEIDLAGPAWRNWSSRCPPKSSARKTAKGFARGAAQT